MKKLLGIVVLCLLWSNVGFAELKFPGLKGTEKFYILVGNISEQGEQICKIKKEEIEATVKKSITSNSKIKYVDMYNAPNEDLLKIEVIRIGSTITANEQICIGDIDFDTWSVGEVENSAGIKYYGNKLSYYGGELVADYIKTFKTTFFLQLEKQTKLFLHHWEIENK